MTKAGAGWELKATSKKEEKMHEWWSRAIAKDRSEL